MNAADAKAKSVSGRREPPAFRNVAVLRTTELTAQMIRIKLGGPELEGFAITEPAASVRLLLPLPGRDALVIPKWNGNEFLLPDGNRPAIRTFTPRYFDAAALELELDMVIHEGGVASAWATTASPGDLAAVSGPGRGHPIDPDASMYLLAGDETAIPAMAQLLEQLPATIPVQVHVEITSPKARLALPAHPQAGVGWYELTAGAAPGDMVVAAVKTAATDENCRVWCAGEAAAMHRVRTHLFKERGLPRTQATVRGYWKA